MKEELIPQQTFMQKAIAVAKESSQKGDYAIGAVIVRNNRIIATGETQAKRINDPTAHAEVVAVRNACKKLDGPYLRDCILYTTHEPCPMCASAAIWAKMGGIVFGATKEDARGKQSENFSWRQIDVSCKDILKKGTPKLELVEGFMREECKKLFELSR